MAALYPSENAPRTLALRGGRPARYDGPTTDVDLDGDWIDLAGREYTIHHNGDRVWVRLRQLDTLHGSNGTEWKRE